MTKEYIIEFVRIDHQVKVTACDPETGVEVSTLGPTTTSKKALTKLAIKKLRYVLAKQQAVDEQGDE